MPFVNTCGSCRAGFEVLRVSTGRMVMCPACKTSTLSKPVWQPPISPKQAATLNDKKPYRLFAGPRRSTKTIAACHLLAHHAWNCKNPNISVVGRALTDNADGGAWQDLVDIVLPQWIEGGFGMKWITRPKMDGLTHKMHCEVSNRHGKVCRIQLDSVKIETEVERIFKGKRFSMVYMTELSNFKRRKTFDVIEESLRRFGLAPEEHLLIGDTNPAEEGEDSWIYQLWYEFPHLDDEGLKEMVKTTNEFVTEEELKNQIEALKELQQKLSLHEFTIDDNIYMSPAEKRAQYAKYAHSQDLLDRYYYGKWKKAATESIFKEVFRPNIHIVGNQEDEFLIPQENGFELLTGWDLGDSNNAWHLIEPYTRMEPDRSGIEKPVPCFKVLDELVERGEKIPLEELVEEILRKMDDWNQYYDKPPLYTHTSDRSAFDRYDKIGNTYEYKAVFNFSDGIIDLQRGPVKKNGSVQQRVDLLKKLLHYNRIFIDSRCVFTIEMLNNLKKGRLSAIDRTSPYKHPFDSLTYALAMRCYAEMEREAIMRTSIQPTASGVTTTALR